jgi:hypothetical protein
VAVPVHLCPEVPVHLPPCGLPYPKGPFPALQEPAVEYPPRQGGRPPWKHHTMDRTASLQGYSFHTADRTYEEGSPGGI